MNSKQSRRDEYALFAIVVLCLLGALQIYITQFFSVGEPFEDFHAGKVPKLPAWSFLIYIYQTFGIWGVRVFDWIFWRIGFGFLVIAGSFFVLKTLLSILQERQHVEEKIVEQENSQTKAVVQEVVQPEQPKGTENDAMGSMASEKRKRALERFLKRD